jgi:AraC-like DNA-binding protein/ligand-binding sensor protein
MSTSSVYDALARSLLALEYEDAFLGATGLSLQLVPSGESIRVIGPRENAFCKLMTQFSGSCAACQEVHDELQRRVAENLTAQIICCFAGLAEFAVPVVVSGQHAATLLGGQVFQRKPTQAQFARLTRQLRAWGTDHKLRQIETNFFQTHVISQKPFQASVRLLTIFAGFLAEDANRNLLAARVHDQPCITTAKNFILAHASEPLRLSDVAEHVHVSTNYFSKFFKKTAGIGFSEFLGRVRVEGAKDLLANSVLSINEVAAQAGFGSLSQFNRTFHRHVGCSPKAYRASLPQAVSL